jgi:tetratricopeptide (TPR) repeat protein
MLLESGRVDDAISLLERSVGLDPANGLNYYYLSEAWLMKGNLVQAEEFNRLAELYLKDDADWRPRIAEQQRQLKKLREWPRH